MKYIYLTLTTLLTTCTLIFFAWFYLFSLPGGLGDLEGIQSVKITDRNGIPLREILSPKDGRARWTKLDQISRHMIDATIIAEDKRFYRHNGIDPVAIIRAAITNLKEGRIVSGGSTITGQLIRVLAPRRRTVLAKIYESLVALRIEMALSKEDILEQYLNRVPFGNQLFGIEAASQMYFEKPARDLSIAEAAFLAILPRAPSAFDPYRHPKKIMNLHRNLIHSLYRSEKISADEMEAALKTPLKLIPKRWAFSAPHFVEMLPLPGRPGSFAHAIAGPLPCGDRGDGGSPHASHPERPGGTNAPTVRTSLDIKLQDRIEGIVESNLKSLAEYNVTNASVVVIDNVTGEVLAMVGSRDYYNEEISGRVNGATSRRQPGSALKPFTYALAMDGGWTASSIIPDMEASFPTEKGDYVPKNYDLRYRGPVRLREALANSLNVPAVYLLSTLGAENLLTKLRQLGLKSLDKDAGYYGLGLTLGNGEVTLLELAAAYSTLARGGRYLPPSLFPACHYERMKRIFSEETVYIVSDILSDDAVRRMTFGEDTPLKLPFRVAAKTGTSKNFRDNWTVGYTPEVTVAVWAGNFDGSPMRGVSGITGAGPIFRETFLAVAKQRQMSWFPAPKNIVRQTICPLSGLAVSKGCSSGIGEIFVRGTAPEEKCKFHVEHLIDTRNNLLAGKGCDERWTAKRGFIDLPGHYHDWAKIHNVSLPPINYSPYCPPQADVETAQQPLTLVERRFKITHPNNNSVYAIDLDIPRRLQTLYFRADAAGPITWSVDGSEIATTAPPQTASWQLAEGKHRISIASRDGVLRDQIEITIYK